MNYNSLIESSRVREAHSHLLQTCEPSPMGINLSSRNASESALTEAGCDSVPDLSALARDELIRAEPRTAMITGAGGLLGRAMHARLTESGWRVLALPRTELDITNEERVRRTVEAAAPSVLINCAATADVDRCEVETDWAYAINEKGPRDRKSV